MTTRKQAINRIKKIIVGTEEISEEMLVREITDAINEIDKL